MNITVKPANPELIVRDPFDNMQPLPASGKIVADSSYWRRRQMDEDVIIVEKRQTRKGEDS